MMTSDYSGYVFMSQAAAAADDVTAQRTNSALGTLRHQPGA